MQKSSQFNVNPAISSTYKLVIPEYEEVTFMVQRTMLPGMRQQAVQGHYINNPTRVPGDTVHYDPLSVDIIVDEELQNIISLQNWLIANKEKNDPWSRCKDIKLHILTRNLTSNKVVTFYKAFPTEIQSVNLDSTLSESEVLVCNVMFEYQYYRIENA